MRKLLIVTMSLVLTCCVKDVKPKDVLKKLELSSHTLDADGASTVNISVTLSGKSSDNRRNIVITNTGGELIGGKDGKLTVPAIYSEGHLVAQATLKAPMDPGKIIITAATETLSPNEDFSIKDSIDAIKVLPAAIKLQPSSFGISSNFQSEDTLIASIKSDKNRNASKGVKVLFEDFVSPAVSASGRYRNSQTTSNSLSQVTTYYSIPSYPLGTNIGIRATVLDDNGNKTNIKDSIVLTVNK
jgi:hypothetical protein